MRKTFEELTIEVIKFAMNETIATDAEAWTPTLSPGVEQWD